SGLDIIDIVEQTKLAMEPAARIYFGVGTLLSLDWLRQQIEVLGVDGHWQAVARATLRDNVYILQRQLCLQVVAERRRQPPAKALEQWAQNHRDAVDYLNQTLTDMRNLPAMDFATLSVALQAVRRMTE